MSELLARLESTDIIGLVAVVLPFLTAVIICLSYQWRVHRRTELEVGLKRDMVERGMSPQDIERVLGAHLSETGNMPARNH